MAEDPLFSVLLPIHRSPELLKFALGSVLEQDIRSLEVLVICDGSPLETVQAATAAARNDQRVKVFVFEKGERLGEAHRDIALREARGRFVCQIADDDLWFRDHLTYMRGLLETVDFGNVLHCYVEPNGSLGIVDADLGDPTTRATMAGSHYNIFGPTSSGYRLEAYKRLPVGWSAAPPDLWTDLHMWRKFIAMPHMTFGTRRMVTTLHFPASLRASMSIEDRAQENEPWSTIIADRAEAARVRPCYEPVPSRDLPSGLVARQQHQPRRHRISRAWHAETRLR